MFDFEALSREMIRQTVLCIGDVMLDEFVYGDVLRISPEAPAPVIVARRTEFNVGGAGNVARNIASLGARCIFVGLVGDDDAGRALKAALVGEPLVEPLLVFDRSRPTTRKVRYVSEHLSAHMLRADWELAQPASEEIEHMLIDAALVSLPRADIVLLSDYAKGALTARVIRSVIDAARKLRKRVIVDPKSANFAIYRGATLLTPNRKEFAEASRGRAGSQAEIAAGARELMRQAECEAMLVTQSEDGMTLVAGAGAPIHVPALPVKVRDVTGAGDTVAAILAVTLAAGADWESALRCANAGGAAAVGKRGAATVSMDELRRKFLPRALLAAEEKIAAAPSDLDARVAAWRREDLRVGFTNGCFDILHPGHVRVLTQARATCDRLIVGLNSDASVRRLKGEGRPVQDERARAEVLAALEAVDLVVIFEDDTPLDLIARIKPSMLIKGGDYTREQVVGHEIVEAHGGEVVLVDIREGFSTTSLVERVRG
jgi:D-beta-D-heptose 7-phosphate kinase/D-beta-D-heptose 1-phosphate adenosyltransferase